MTHDRRRTPRDPLDELVGLRHRIRAGATPNLWAALTPAERRLLSDHPDLLRP